MSRSCEKFQRLIMEYVDLKQSDFDPTIQQHLEQCTRCRDWMAYLQSESAAFAQWSASPAPSPDWSTLILRVSRSSKRRFLIPVLTLTAAGLLVAFLILPNFFTGSEPMQDTSLIQAISQFDSLTTLDASPTIPEYLDQTGLLWTSEDLSSFSDDTQSTIKKKPERKEIHYDSPFTTLQFLNRWV